VRIVTLRPRASRLSGEIDNCAGSAVCDVAFFAPTSAKTACLQTTRPTMCRISRRFLEARLDAARGSDLVMVTATRATTSLRAPQSR